MASRRAGFTLVELVMVIVLLGIVGLVVGQIILAAGRGYRTRTTLKELQDAGRLALTFVDRELREAVPDSVRVLDGGTVLEYGRTVFGGGYDTGAAAAISGPVLTVLDDLSGRDFSGCLLVIYNTSSADFYGGGSTFPIIGNSAGSITCSTTIDRTSPYGRYYVCDAAVKLKLAADELLYCSGYRPGDAETGCQPLIDGVTSLEFQLHSGTRAEAMLVAVRLTLARDDLTVRLGQQVRLLNFP
ncbi:MAG: prepilin-type N-terminal cleavage/methylation domain-containing protein [Deltaproteobacteria bacterium]|nr:prepilin-type N-terminal cleavage/methylation domain-containing protein [Candidatus Anaeroferrophillacea bacterium]